MSFDKIHTFVMKWEGGLTDDANDPGGITNYGVCLRFLQSVDPKATRDDIIHMTPEKAKQLFYDHFWLKCKCDQLPDKIAMVVYDTAVNTGCSQSIKFLQRALSIQDDGIIGPQTLSEASHCNVEGCVWDFLRYRAMFYENLANKKPSLKCFLKGWLNRVAGLRELCTTC